MIRVGTCVKTVSEVPTGLKTVEFTGNLGALTRLSQTVFKYGKLLTLQEYPFEYSYFQEQTATFSGFSDNQVVGKLINQHWRDSAASFVVTASMLGEATGIMTTGRSSRSPLMGDVGIHGKFDEPTATQGHLWVTYKPYLAGEVRLDVESFGIASKQNVELVEDTWERLHIDELIPFSPGCIQIENEPIGRKQVSALADYIGEMMSVCSR